MVLEWKQVDHPLPQMTMWRAERGKFSYVITYDHYYPGGYAASIADHFTRKYVDEKYPGFLELDNAKAWCEEHASQHYTT